MTQYWDDVLAALARYPARPEIEPLPLRSTTFATLYGVRLTSLGPYRLFGYLSIPTGAGPFPAIYYPPKYQSVLEIIPQGTANLQRSRYVTFSLAGRGQRNADAPYAQYLIAMSYYQQIDDVNRDQTDTQQASDAFNDLIRRYPDTRYAADARIKLDLIKDHLAGKEMEIGRFYQRSGQWLAATYRFRTVVDQYQTTTGTPEALERLVECYLALGMPEEAQKAAAVLGRNYPESYWYSHSLQLLGRENKQVQRIDRRTASRK